MLGDNQNLKLGKQLQYKLYLTNFFKKIINYKFFYISAGECQILDFQTQQYKIFPAIAISFAYKCAASWLWNIYKGVISMLNKGDLELLPEVCFT